MPGSVNLTCHELIEISTVNLKTVKGTVGPDNIPPSFLKSLDPLVLQKLLSIFNSFFSLAHCPRIWRVAIIILLLKAGEFPSEDASFPPSVLHHLLSNFWISKRSELRRSDYSHSTNNRRWFSTTPDVTLRNDSVRFQQSIRYGLERKVTASYVRYWFYSYIHPMDSISFQRPQSTCSTL